MRDCEPYAIREVFAHSLDDFLEDHYTSRVQRDAANAIADCRPGGLESTSRPAMSAVILKLTIAHAATATALTVRA